MPTKSELEEVPREDGSTGKKLHVEFSNGSLEQLEELAKYYNVPNQDVAEVVQLGISLLQNFKEKGRQEKDNTGV